MNTNEYLTRFVEVDGEEGRRYLFAGENVSVLSEILKMIKKASSFYVLATVSTT
jgi:hypothetical protein